MATLEQKVKFVYNSNRLDGVHIPYEKTLEMAQAPPDGSGESTRELPAIEHASAVRADGRGAAAEPPGGRRPPPTEGGSPESTIVGMDGRTRYERGAVLSHLQALYFVEALGREARPYTAEDLREVHRRLMDGVILSGGEYRECTLKYRAVPPLAPAEIPRRLERVLSIMNLGVERARSREVLAWQVHHEFLFVHPFIEGNGRTARLLLNLVRFRAGLDLELVPFAEHERYLRSLMDYGTKLAAAVAPAK